MKKIKQKEKDHQRKKQLPCSPKPKIVGS